MTDSSQALAVGNCSLSARLPPTPQSRLLTLGGGSQALAHPRVQSPISGIHTFLSLLQLLLWFRWFHCANPVCILGTTGPVRVTGGYLRPGTSQRARGLSLLAPLTPSPKTFLLE